MLLVIERKVVWNVKLSIKVSNKMVFTKDLRKCWIFNGSKTCVHVYMWPLHPYIKNIFLQSLLISKYLLYFSLAWLFLRHITIHWVYLCCIHFTFSHVLFPFSAAITTVAYLTFIGVTIEIFTYMSMLELY